MRCLSCVCKGMPCAVQAQQPADAERPRFRLTRADVWQGLRGLLRLSHAAALAAMLREVPELFDSISTAATSAEQRSFVAVACLQELCATLGPQVAFCVLISKTLQASALV